MAAFAIFSMVGGMTRIKVVSAVVGLASIPLVSIAIWLFGPSVMRADFADQRVHESPWQAGTVGERRDAILRKLTSQYVAQADDIASSIAMGKELAPVSYLNTQLAERGASWRVRSVDGLSAETYLIS